MGPNTKILFGDHNLDYGSFSGARIDAGFWLPQCPVIGLEANFFALQTRSVNFSAFSDPNGDQILGRPVIIVTNGQSPIEQVYLDSWPGQSSGGVSVSSNSQFDSWEINVVANLLRTRSLDWDLTVGFRSLDLIENLRIEDVAFPLSNAAGFTFLGSPVGPPSTLADFDHFRTTNHFYGGQLGSKLVWSEGLVDVGLTAKVALGATQQGINIDGGSVLLTPSSPPVTAPGGILAQPTNMGLTYRSVFTVVPEVGLNLGYQITPWLRAQVGYTFLYWSDVVRPGNQIDRAVNPSQVPTDQTYVGSTGTVPARPTLTPQTTDFWVQGINFGLEFRF